MSPALGGFNPRSPFGQLRGQKPQVPQLFFTLTEEEIVKLLVSQGFSEKTATQEAAKFMKYKASIVGPKQVWSKSCTAHPQHVSSCKECQQVLGDADIPSQGKTEATTKRLADEVAGRKGE